MLSQAVQDFTTQQAAAKKANGRKETERQRVMCSRRRPCHGTARLRQEAVVAAKTLADTLVNSLNAG